MNKMEDFECINPWKFRHGAVIWNCMLKIPVSKLSLGAKVVYARLCQFAGRNSKCFPKINTISNEIGLSRRQSERYLKELKDYNLIRALRTKKDIKFNRPCTYIFLNHEIFKNEKEIQKTVKKSKKVKKANDKSDITLNDNPDITPHDKYVTQKRISKKRISINNKVSKETFSENSLMNLDNDSHETIKVNFAKTYPKIIKSNKSTLAKSNSVPVPDNNKILSVLAKDCLAIWLKYGGRGYSAKAHKSLFLLNDYVDQLFDRRTNPYNKIDSLKNDDNFNHKLWTLDEFEEAVKAFFADKKNEKSNLAVHDFIFQDAYKQGMWRNSKLVEYFKTTINKYDFKGENATIATYLLRFYKNQIGNPEEVNPGVFVNIAKNIKELEKSFIVNPGLMHPENQLWYKYMQYIKEEMKTNPGFLPNYMSSQNFVQKFISKAQQNGALVDRRRGEWS